MNSSADIGPLFAVACPTNTRSESASGAAFNRASSASISSSFILSLQDAGLVDDEVQGDQEGGLHGEGATPVVREISRSFMGRLSLTRGAGSEARVASSAPPRRDPQAGGGGLRSRSYCCCS